MEDLLAHMDYVKGWGFTMDFGPLWKLARGWHAGWMERGHNRHKPEGAAGYFAEVGLKGAFWGLSHSGQHSRDFV